MSYKYTQTLRRIGDTIGVAWKQTTSFIRRRLILTLVFIVIASLLAALAPVALKLLIDGMTDENWPPYHIWSYTLIPGPAFLILIYLFSLWLSRLLEEIRWLTFGRADQRLHRYLSRRLFEHVIYLPLKFHLNRKIGGLNQILVNGLTGYSIILQHLTFSILPVFLETVIIGVMLVTFYPPEFIIILVLTLVAYIVAFSVGMAQITGPSREVADAQTEACSTLTDNILNTETIKYYSAEPQTLERYDNILSCSENKWAIFYNRKMINGLWVASIFTLSLGTSIVLAAEQVLQGTMTIGDFILINTYMLQITRPMETLGFALRDIAHGISFTGQMAALLHKSGERPNTPSDHNPGPCKGKITFEGVTFSYIPGFPVLKDISFTVHPGKTLAVVGPSGSGKSSLIRLLFRFFDVDSGTILLDDTPITDLSLYDLRQAIAVVPQDTILFHDTIACNIAIGKPGCAPGEMIDAAKLAHLHNSITAMPEGYQTIVGERGLKLSGGEKQRISIARAILKKPRIFIFDEATSSLDISIEKKILENLIGISTNITTLMIAHRMSTVIHADEILFLERGKIIERGNHLSLLKKDGRYAAMWRAQQKAEP